MKMVESFQKSKNMTPLGNHRMGANPHANGGILLKSLRTPDFREFGVLVPNHGGVMTSDMMQLGKYVERLILLNEDNHNFRIFGPDEALSNRLNHIFDATKRQWEGKILDSDEYLSNSGRVIDSYLSEHVCEGWLEGYLLTGRHGFFHCYEAFIRVVDSMASQHAKWLKVCRQLAWRYDISSLNYILTSHIWQQDHNGFTHQDPGFLNHLITKKRILQEFICHQMLIVYYLVLITALRVETILMLLWHLNILVINGLVWMKLLSIVH